MHKVLGVLVALFAVLVLPLWPSAVYANTASDEHEVVIHAQIAAARFIIVNNQGQMTTIFSNTNQSVTPEVHLGHLAGSIQQLTPALLTRYNQIIQSHANMAGIKIAVPPQTPQQARTTITAEQLVQSRDNTASVGVQKVAATKFIAQLSPPFFIKS